MSVLTPPTIAVTPGEPAGIGPEILVQLAQNQLNAKVVAIADPQLLMDRARLLGLELNLVEFDDDRHRNEGLLPAKNLLVSPVVLNDTVKLGVLNPNNGGYVLETLKVASQGCLTNRWQAIVTGPVSKSVINDAGVPFSGHTEFFAEQASVDRVVMMLATEGLRVALVTTHLPLAKVPQAITASLLTEILEITHSELREKFGLESPKIKVCGLNPHAGESGHMGREEIDVIIPVLETLKLKGLNLDGPYPADTVFTPRHMQDCDTIVAMYHDQGLPVLKYKGFHRAVNITLGLPFIRTSVDHGTALDLAGQGTASHESLAYALDTAIEMANAQH
ncbi:4-hydroxythreonine-4-phosphate dehydrogenase PdxA [Sessilibacter sp. MAH4]